MCAYGVTGTAVLLVWARNQNIWFSCGEISSRSLEIDGVTCNLCCPDLGEKSKFLVHLSRNRFKIA